ncbi:hypothetical protein HDU67_008687, partial [Dinochytrium kinnereticum]
MSLTPLKKTLQRPPTPPHLPDPSRQFGAVRSGVVSTNEEDMEKLVALKMLHMHQTKEVYETRMALEELQ